MSDSQKGHVRHSTDPLRRENKRGSLLEMFLSSNGNRVRWSSEMNRVVLRSRERISEECVMLRGELKLTVQKPLSHELQ